MAEEVTGVPADSPSAEEQAQAQAAAAQGAGDSPVAAEDSSVDAQGVPWKNRMAEMERRMAKQFQDAMAQQQAQLQQQMAAYAQQFAPRPAAAETKSYTDEELLTLANQGHSAALDMLMDRKIAARQQQHQTAQQKVTIAQTQVRTLIARYPDAGNASTPLGQYIAQVYQGYTANGYPQTPDTVLLAMTTAIADRPDLATQTQQRAAAVEGGRTSAVQQHGAIGETTHRTVPKRGPTYEPTDAEKKLATAMGVKDPKKARERFIERNRTGRSAVSTTVSQALGDL
jgi:hypothetical protein